MTPFTPEQIAALATLKRAWPARRLVLIGAAALGFHIDMRWRRTNDLDLTLVAEPDEVAADLRAMKWSQDDRRSVGTAQPVCSWTCSRSVRRALRRASSSSAPPAR